MNARSNPGAGETLYAQIIECVFLRHYRSGVKSFEFRREELAECAAELGVDLPKNLGDVIYSFRYRRQLPDAIQRTAPEAFEWTIRGAGRSAYEFSLTPEGLATITPNELLSETKIPDSTPGLIAKYALSDEQALLAVLRYNRLVDVFTGVTCYSLQNHLRTTVRGVGQVETDELYVGVDRRGVHYAFPVQAKGGTDLLSIVQIEQDLRLCREKFPHLVARPLAAQFMADDLVALFEFEDTEDGVRLVGERHYRLVEPDGLSEADLVAYRERLREGE